MGPQQDPSTAPTAPRANGTAAGRKEGNKVVRYRQCQRNHAASTGGHAVDGCREFMASAAAETGTGAAAALLCAACGCHRSFHRREVEAEAAAQRYRDCDAPPTPPAPGDRR